MSGTKNDIINQLQEDILQWEGCRPPPAGTRELVGLGPAEAAFPNGVLPLCTVHERACNDTE